MNQRRIGVNAYALLIHLITFKCQAKETESAAIAAQAMCPHSRELTKRCHYTLVRPSLGFAQLMQYLGATKLGDQVDRPHTVRLM
jgi:hypothetical protein